MAIRTTKEWLDLIAAIAVVAGLVLVAYEVRQSNVLARAQTENSIYQGWEILAMSEIETGINEVIGRSIDDPDSLTDAEIRDINSWLVAVISIYSRNSRLFHEYGLATDPMFEHDVPYFFGSETARNWYADNESWIRSTTPELADAIDQFIQSSPIEGTAPAPTN